MFLINYLLIFRLTEILLFLLFVASMILIFKLWTKNSKMRIVLENEACRMQELEFLLEIERNMLRSSKNSLIKSNDQLTSALQIIKKIEVLKKHLSEFFERAEPCFKASDKSVYKTGKMNVDSFFHNHSELSSLAQSNASDYFSLELVEAKLSTSFTEKEVEVAKLILDDYTTKEIGVLLSKSEKAIEYARKKMREKMNLSTEKDLYSGLNALFVGSN